MKKMKFNNTLTTLLLTIVAAAAFTGCKKDDNNTGSGTTSTTIKITDAAIDDASVTGAFVTISDIRLDGQSVQGFTKTTVDVNAYRNGNTKSIGTFNLPAKTYSTITFVLDFDTDASGTAPGSYIVTNGTVKHKLQSTSNTITISKSLTLSGSSSIVADFDLRKMIIPQAGGADQYDFAAAADLQTSVRVVEENKTGVISGTLTNNLAGSGKVIAYAYKKGSFNRAAEMQSSGASSIQFKNAVSSSVVSATGNYQLHFLESGDYEIHFANYTDSNADGKLELSGTLVVLGAVGLDLLNLNLGTGATVTANATATAILP